jgi:hypothetical protein
MSVEQWTDWELLEARWEERAAILEFESDYSQFEAENLAAQLYGFHNKAHLKSHIQELKAKVVV